MAAGVDANPSVKGGHGRAIAGVGACVVVSTTHDPARGRGGRAREKAARA